jgi:hypothetical protein
MFQQNIVDSAFALQEDERQGSLFVEVAKLSEAFYDQLQRHPVPVEEAAIRAVNNNSMALDLYAWLAYRLHSIPNPRPISWKALSAQFGQGYGRLDNFKARFVPNLKLALAVYPAAKVDIEDKGLVLHPSRPPVASKIKSIGG